MARIEKTVFISYRRTDVYTALAVYENLKNQGYDVFFDYRSISSGDFEQIIHSNIRARAHFLLILTPTALDRCNEPSDWLRREIEFAIDERRNIIPLFFRGFRFGDSSITDKLTGKLINLSRYNGLNVHEDYFDEAMHRLRTQYLNIPLDTVLHPVSTEVQKVVRAEQVAADKALEQIEDVKELVKQVDETVDQPKAKPKSKRKKIVPAFDIPVPEEKIVSSADTVAQNVDAKRRPVTHLKTQEGPIPREVAKSPTPGSNLNFQLVGGIAGGLLMLGLLIWGASKLFSNLSAAPEPTQTLPTSVISSPQPSAIITPQTSKANTPSPTQTSIPLSQTTIPPNSSPAVGSTLTGKDGMTLLYVPAGEFTMGSETNANEDPIHKVTLDAFWVDQTEVTNKMYALCVDADACQAPTNISSYTHSSYYGNSEFDDYPVIYVDWYMAKTYCKWADRRLPTEAEWEKAARGENALVYPWGNYGLKNDVLNYNGNVGDTTKVGKYPNGVSPYGALDMAGNVWEWVSSLYQPYPYSATDGREDLSANGNRVLRGGSWTWYIPIVRSAFRNEVGPTLTDDYIGFRCAMSATP